MLSTPPPINTNASAPSFSVESHPVTGSTCGDPDPAPPGAPPAGPPAGLPPGVAGRECRGGELAGAGFPDGWPLDGWLLEDWPLEGCAEVCGPTAGPCGACADRADECESMRKATLARATVNTISSEKRSASIRTPAPRTDKLHHMAAG